MIAICVCFFLLLQVITLQFYLDIISAEQLIVILYLFNILLIACILECALNFSKTGINKSVLTALRDVRYALIKGRSPTNQKDRNLYIEWWKKRFLYQTQTFPLDRLAYLSAKYYRCPNDVCFLLKVSQIKDFVKKPAYRPEDVCCYEKFYEDPHPTKLINKLSQVYIHRRAEFYRLRGVSDVPHKQVTIKGEMKRKLTYEDDSDEEKDSHFSVAKRLSAAYIKVRNSFSQEDDNSDDDSEVRQRRSIWRKLSSVFTGKKSS